MEIVKSERFQTWDRKDIRLFEELQKFCKGRREGMQDFWKRREKILKEILQEIECIIIRDPITSSLAPNPTVVILESGPM